MPATQIAADRLWYAVPQLQAVTWGGAGWAGPGAVSDLAAHGFAVLAEVPDGLLVAPMPAWQLPARPAAGDAYECTRLASERLAERGDLAAAARLLAEANRLLDDHGHAGSAPGLTAVPATPDAVAGWYGRPSLLSATVGRLRAAGRADPGSVEADSAPALPAIVRGLPDGAWCEVFPAGRVSKAVAAHSDDLTVLAEAWAGGWPGLRYVSAALARHPLAEELRYLHRVLSQAPDVASIATRPRPELVADFPPGQETTSTVEAEWAVVVLWWAYVGPELLASPVPYPAATQALGTIDVVRRLTMITVDVLGGAPPSMVLGDPYGGGCR